MIKDDLKEIFNKDIKIIYDKIEMQEVQFNRRYRHLTSYIEKENVKNLVDEFKVYTDDEIQEERCQVVNRLLQKEILIKKHELKKDISSRKLLDYPDWVKDLEILKEEHRIVNYIEDTKYCFKLPEEGDKFLEKWTGMELKQELLEFVSGEEYIEYYNQFSIEDYDKAISYVNIKLNNEKIYELEDCSDELTRFYALFHMFDYEYKDNIYASSFIEMVTLFGVAIIEIAKNVFPLHVTKRQKLTNVLVAIKQENPNFYYLNGQDTYIQLMELIARRNVYIHNKGIIDWDYLNFGKICRASVWNQTRFILGDFAKIDSYYFSDAYNLLEMIISAV